MTPLTYGAILAAILSGTLVLGALSGFPAVIRNRKFRRSHPAAVVLASVVSTDLVDGFRTLSRLERRSIGTVPFSLSIVLDEQGIGVWSGLLRIRRFCFLPWDAIEAIEPYAFRRGLWRGVEVRVIARDGSAALHFPVFGWWGQTLSIAAIREALADTPRTR